MNELYAYVGAAYAVANRCPGCGSPRAHVYGGMKSFDVVDDVIGRGKQH